MPHDDLTIVYEDRSLLLCVKPVGVLSEDSENGASMPHLLRQHYAAAHQPDYIATVHRLDKVTGGLMLFSRQRAVTVGSSPLWRSIGWKKNIWPFSGDILPKKRGS